MYDASWFTASYSASGSQALLQRQTSQLLSLPVVKITTQAFACTLSQAVLTHISMCGRSYLTWIQSIWDASALLTALLTALGSRVATPLQATSHADGADQQKANAFVGSLTGFDRRMNQVVVDSGILKGIPEGRLQVAGEAFDTSIRLVLHWFGSL